MKKQIVVLLAGAMLMMATSALAFTVGGVNVGAVDSHLTSAAVNSGYANELAWVNGIVNPDYASFTKYEQDESTAWNWKFVDGSTTVVAANVLSAPDYYFIKIGTGNLGVGKGGKAVDHYLFKNDPSNVWAVVDLATSFDSALYDLNLLNNGGIGRFSHEGGFGGGTPVPEPGTLMLLGVGMLGLAVAGKRRMNKA